MSGAAGKAASAISGLFSSFMSGGVVGAIIGAITAAVGLLVKAFNDAKQRAKDAAEAMRNYFSNAFDKSSEAAKRFLDMLAGMKADNKMLGEEIDFENESQHRMKVTSIKEKALKARGKTENDIDKQLVSAKERRDLALEELKY